MEAHAREAGVLTDKTVKVTSDAEVGADEVDGDVGVTTLIFLIEPNQTKRGRSS